MRRWAFLFLFAIELCVFAQSQRGIAIQNASDVVFPIFIAGEPESVAVVKIGRISREMRRKGFFRVAALPYLQLNNVQIEFRGARSSARAIAELRSAIEKRFRTEAFDISDVVLVFDHQKRTTVSAARLRFIENGRCILTSVEVRSEATHCRGEFATLSLTKGLALELHSNGMVTKTPLVTD